MSRTNRTAVVLLGTLFLQQAIAAPVTVFGARLDLLVVVGLAAGVAGGPDRGAVVGFVAGLLMDLTIGGPFGLSALLYAVAGWSIGTVQRSFVGPSWWVGPVGVGLASGATVVAYVGIGVLLGHTEWVSAHAVRVLVVVTVGGALFSPLAIRIMQWTEGEPLGLRLPGWWPSRPSRGRRAGALAGARSRSRR